MLMGKLRVTEPTVDESTETSATQQYWTAVEHIVEWAGKQHLVVQPPLPLPEPKVKRRVA